MGTVHSLVTEVLAYLINTLKAAYDKTLKIELGSDTAVEVYIQGVMVCDERTCAGTSGDRLQYGGLYLSVTGTVKH
jgi:hypothetical protein